MCLVRCWYRMFATKLKRHKLNSHKLLSWQLTCVTVKNLIYPDKIRYGSTLPQSIRVTIRTRSSIRQHWSLKQMAAFKEQSSSDLDKLSNLLVLDVHLGCPTVEISVQRNGIRMEMSAFHACVTIIPRSNSKLAGDYATTHTIIIINTPNDRD